MILFAEVVGGVVKRFWRWGWVKAPVVEPSTRGFVLSLILSPLVDGSTAGALKNQNSAQIPKSTEA